MHRFTHLFIRILVTLSFLALPNIALAKRKKHRAGSSAPTTTAPATNTQSSDAPRRSGGSFKSRILGGNQDPYTLRAIAIRRGMLRADVGPADWAFLSASRGWMVERPAGGMVGAGLGEPQVGFFTGWGAAFSPVENLETGLVLFPLYWAPAVQFADIPIYGRYAFLKSTHLEVAGQLTLWIPTGSSMFSIAPALPVLWRPSAHIRVDTGAQFRFSFGQGASSVGLEMPFALNVQVTEKVYVGGRTGFAVNNFSDSSSIALPLGAQMGVHIIDGLMDVTGWFYWPNFLTPAAPEGANKVNADLFQIGAGATGWFQLL